MFTKLLAGFVATFLAFVSTNGLYDGPGNGGGYGPRHSAAFYPDGTGEPPPVR